MSYAPIVLFVYNRLEHTKRTVEALRMNDLSIASDLYIYSDGAKDIHSETKVKNVRDYLTTISGFKSIKIIKSNINLGLANSIINGVTEIVNRFGNIIVLEDDHITSPFFLRFMNQALEMYKDEKEVASIHGYIYPITELPETFFIKGADCWGWATWSRAWQYFEPDGKKLMKIIRSNKIKKDFNFNNSYDYFRMLENQIEGKNDSWAIRWYASAFINNMYTLYPGQSLVYNSGNDGTGTHSKSSFNYNVKLAQKINLNKIAILENIENRKKFEIYFNKLKPNFINRLKTLLNIK